MVEVREVVVGGLIGDAVGFLVAGDGVARVREHQGVFQDGELAMVDARVGPRCLRMPSSSDGLRWMDALSALMEERITSS